MPGLLDKAFKLLSGRYFFVPFITLSSCDLHFKLSTPTLNLTTFVTGGGVLKAVDVIAKYPNAWSTLKIAYIVISIIGIAITTDLIYRNIFMKLLPKHAKTEDLLETRPPPYPYNEDKLQMIVGLKHERLTTDKAVHPTWIIVTEKGMYQNFLITGTIGTGKTASGMYPFTKQAIFYKAYDRKLKPGMLILDVKGNFYKQVVKFAEEAGRQDDVIIIELNGEYKYNPVHKPGMRPLVLANRSKTVLSLFSPRGASDGYWLDKAELLIAECIKLSRLYNGGYTTFVEINKLVNNKAYLDSRISELLEDSKNSLLSDVEDKEFETSLDYFDNEYTLNIVATQSYTSLINTLRDRDVVRTISQNLINKIWLRTDDLFTVEEAQKQTGREDKEKVSRSISENAGDVKKNRVLGTLVADKSSVSETINVNTVREYVFDEKLFTQKLDVFTGICFLSDGAKILEPTVVHLQPYFNDTIKKSIQSKKLVSSSIGANKEHEAECLSTKAGSCEGEKKGGDAARQKVIERDSKRNNRTINLKERGVNHAGAKKEKIPENTRNDDLI